MCLSGKPPGVAGLTQSTGWICPVRLTGGTPKTSSRYENTCLRSAWAAVGRFLRSPALMVPSLRALRAPSGCR
eukprot:3741539-Pyramimonas_sp.AAC.1